MVALTAVLSLALAGFAASVIARGLGGTAE